jgi:DNA-binding transcriptional MerR regulator
MAVSVNFLLKTSAVKHFGIKDLERFSAIKAHTIRIWEQRYAVFTPLRNTGNLRRYTVEDVHRLLCISTLIKNGHKISALANSTTTELELRLEHSKDDEFRQSLAIGKLIYYMYCDLEKLEDLLDDCVQHWGIDQTIENIIVPLLEKVDLLSYKDKTYEVHFTVVAIRKKIMFGIEKEKQPIHTQQSPALLFLQEGEHYDLFLLYMYYVLRKRGVRVLYLGTDISTKNLCQLISDKQPKALYTYVTDHKKLKLDSLAHYLKESYPDTLIHAVTCQDVQGDKQVNNITFVPYHSFREWVTNR